MKHWAVALIALMGFSLGQSQIPDVQIKFDARLSYRSFNDNSTEIRWYDTLGRQSLVGLQLQLEPGLRMYVSERLERIPHDGDPDVVDEYYIEDVGSWRIGKQAIPFGRQILRECAVGARSDTSLFLRALPIKVAIFDSGSGRQRGFSGRIGKNIGASFAYGDHLGISGTSLTLIRRPDESTGKEFGYRRLFGLDMTGVSRPFKLGMEFVSLRQGSSKDPDEDVLDVAASLEPNRYQSVTFGVTRAFRQAATFLRLQGNVYVYNNVYLEPLVRYKDGKLYDFAVSMHLKF